jgi:hypothetical protein
VDAASAAKSAPPAFAAKLAEAVSASAPIKATDAAPTRLALDDAISDPAIESWPCATRAAPAISDSAPEIDEAAAAANDELLDALS